MSNTAKVGEPAQGKVSLDAIEQYIGKTFVSNWHTIDQARINGFGRVTDDPDPAHIDPAWARQHSPWGGPVAFGFLTMSMLTPLVYDVFDIRFDGSAERHHANYGFNRMRLVEAVPSGARVRAHVTVKEVAARKPGQALMVLDVTMEIEGKARPALTGEWLSMLFRPSEVSAGRATGN